MLLPLNNVIFFYVKVIVSKNQKFSLRMNKKDNNNYVQGYV